MQKIGDDMIAAVPEYIALHDPPVHYDRIRAELQQAWWAIISIYNFLIANAGDVLLKEFEQLFPHGKSAQLQHVGGISEIDRRLNGAESRTGELMGWIVNAKAFNKTLDDPRMLPESCKILLVNQERLTSLWDLLNQAAYRAQDLAGKISPVFHQLEFDPPTDFIAAPQAPPEEVKEPAADFIATPQAPPEEVKEPAADPPSPMPGQDK